MVEPVLLDRALCLPAPDIAALLEGQIVAAIPKMPAQKGWTFALYPCDAWVDSVSWQRQYRSHALSLARAALNRRQTNTVKIEAWAKCENCSRLYEAEQLKALSHLTIWTVEALQEALKQRQHIFLACLRVYRLPQPIEVSADAVTPEKFGRFLGLPVLEVNKEQFSKPLQIAQLLPVLDESIFTQRQQRLENLEPPEHPELEELYSAIANLQENRQVIEEVQQDLRVILGWSDTPARVRPNPDLDWIRTIADVGNSSEGHKFEKLVRAGLIKLGFQNSANRPEASLDPEATGGAGGLDFYCDSPYFLVGECKATKTTTVPDGTAAQLIKLGYKHLQHYDQCIKLIVAAGDLTSAALQTSIGNKINVIRPETLQSLVEMQATYRGSVDLIELKKCLQDTYGLVDDKIEKYLAQVRNSIKLRAQIIEAVQQLTEPDKKQLSVVEVRVQYNAMFAQDAGSKLIDSTVHELLIELASPLTGYLGRVQGSGLQSDRFYFLRDLVV